MAKNMKSKYVHGGGYRQAAIKEGFNWNEVMDYSISINWKASEFYPESLIYIHHENVEYSNPFYPALTEIIEDVYKLHRDHFVLTNGANEAIANFFHFLAVERLNESRKVILVGPTYSEYHKFASLNGFECIEIDLDQFQNKKDSFYTDIVVFVNPNTPYGYVYDLRETISELLKSGTLVVLDESFIDFTEKPSLVDLIDVYDNLYIVKSLTKFYGSAGARLGMLISSNILLKSVFAKILPPWNISAYDSWFYQNMIPSFNKIQKATFSWIDQVNKSLAEVMNDSQDIKLHSGSMMCFHVLEMTDKFIQENNISDLQRFFLVKYKVYVRPTADFYGCPENSFRVGLRLPGENIPVLEALKDIG